MPKPQKICILTPGNDRSEFIVQSIEVLQGLIIEAKKAVNTPVNIIILDGGEKTKLSEARAQIKMCDVVIAIHDLFPHPGFFFKLHCAAIENKKCLLLWSMTIEDVKKDAWGLAENWLKITVGEFDLYHPRETLPKILKEFI